MYRWDLGGSEKWNHLPQLYSQWCWSWNWHLCLTDSKVQALSTEPPGAVCQIQNQNCGGSLLLLIQVFPKIRPRLTGGEQNSCTEWLQGITRKTGRKKKRKERKKGREGKKARKAEEEETDLMTNTWNRITHCSCKVLSAFGQSSIQFPMPEGWACTDFPPLPRSSRPCLHHLSGDLETKWISRSHGKGSAKTLSSWDVRLSQSFLPSKSKRESPSFQPFWLFPPTFFFFFNVVEHKFT